jgi:hypothetical protein
MNITTDNSTIVTFYFFPMALPAHSGTRPYIKFRNHFSQTVGLLGRVISPSQGRYLNTGQHKHRINTYTYQTSIPWVGFERTIPVSELVKTIHALDRAATVAGSERAKTVHALDRAATVTGSERTKTVHALDRTATVTSLRCLSMYELRS